MVGLIALVTVGWASESACELPTVSPDDRLSVAWVSPLGARTSGNAYLWLVPTAELSAWVSSQPQSSVGRMLQHLGLRKRDRDPGRRWKVTVFDARAGDLCRPVEGAEEGSAAAGLAVCDERRSKPTAGVDGCGRTRERASGELGLPLFRARWNDIARDGFCVLPAERFVEGPR